MIFDTTRSNNIAFTDTEHPQLGGVRLGTLVLIRWLAIGGQLLALAVVHFLLEFDVQPGFTLPTIMASGLLNLWFALRVDTNTRLTDAQSTAHLTFDLIHLAVLLFLTGGLSNPFTVLMLAPPSVSATMLAGRSTKLLILISIGLLTSLAFTPFPLPWKGTPLKFDTLFLLGVWFSLCITLIFLALYMMRVGKESRERAQALSATQTALAQEQKLAELGTLAAAAAHELGTPLGTVMLVSNELLKTWDGDANVRTDLELIVDQISRCRDILAELSENRRAGDSNHFTIMDVEALLREAAAPHEERGPCIRYHRVGDEALKLHRMPEQIHAFRSIIENATGFAVSEVCITTTVGDEKLTIIIEDDGPGFDPQIFKRLGEPYVTTRQPTPGKDGGLGLGLFIAKTLLERTGCTVTFSASKLGGACIEMVWPRDILMPTIADDGFDEEETAHE
ncbi:MAG: ActS/PrrB/RegB family redox-sensitive histidine kinase [Kordiimonadaceae bacterium]|nr:ActS/PrrB/RegB family redox-sensitive histidine kinase [Kordiimonadaceae bacterium]